MSSTHSTERNSNPIDCELGFIWPSFAESHFLASRKTFLSLGSETGCSLLLFHGEDSAIGPAGVGALPLPLLNGLQTVSSLTVHMPCKFREYTYFSKLENRNRGSWYSPVLNATQNFFLSYAPHKKRPRRAGTTVRVKIDRERKSKEVPSSGLVWRGKLRRSRRYLRTASLMAQEKANPTWRPF